MYVRAEHKKTTKCTLLNTCTVHAALNEKRVGDSALDFLLSGLCVWGTERSQYLVYLLESLY